MAPRTKTPEAPHADADDATATADNASAAVRAAVSGYDPNEDPRVWRTIAGMWRAAAHELVELAENLVADGRIGDVVPRLKKSLGERCRQEPGELQSAVETFAKEAERLFLDDARQNQFCAAVLEQIQSQERAKSEAREASIRREQDRREQRAAELEAEAEALRQGPVRPASFIAIPSLG
jgi:hypothetical protein